MLIYFKFCFGFKGFIYPCSRDPKFDIKNTLKDNSITNIEIIPAKKSIIGHYQTEITDELLKELKSGLKTISSDQKKELKKIQDKIFYAVRNILRHLKYHFNQYNIVDESISVSSHYWSEDASNWKSFQHIFDKGYSSIIRSVPLNKYSLEILQNYINNGPEPFISLKYLHLAQNESDLHLKWVTVTLAAELAIKEFLIKIKPELKKFLFEIPSPPLDKLYGSILESLINIKSPKVKEIKKGIEIRNKIIHKPEDVKISFEAAHKYVDDIEYAIYHLLSLLHSEDQLISNIFNLEKGWKSIFSEILDRDNLDDESFCF